MSDAPWPIIEIAIEARFGGDRDRLLGALHECAEADRELQFLIDRESGQTVIRGISEAHLAETIEMLGQVHGLGLKVATPRIIYRKTMTRHVEKDYTYKKSMSGSYQFARVKMVFKPAQRGKGSSFESKVVDGAIPDPFIVGVEAGIAEVMGVRAGYTLMDIQVVLTDGAFHATDSTALTFQLASRAAFREALCEGGSILLEPIMSIEVTTSVDHVGSVLADLRGRRGRILSQTMRRDRMAIEAVVPLANLFGYGNHLRSFAAGQATLTSTFAGYEPCPAGPDKWQPPAAAVALRG